MREQTEAVPVQAIGQVIDACAEGTEDAVARARPRALEPGLLEMLPCLAMIERAGVIVGMNEQARRLTGLCELNLPLDRLLLGAYATTQRRRLRFDCLVLRRHGAPMQACAAMVPVLVDGEECRLITLVEREQGFAGAVESDGSFLEDVLDATPEATVLAHEGRVLHVNRAFSQLFGYSREECVGQELDALVVPEGLQHESEMLLYALRQEGRSGVETVRRTRNGDAVPVSVLVAAVRLGGTATGLFVVYRDIRRQKLEEARLEHTALHDGLTGLANRALFLQRVEMTLERLRRRPDRDFAVVFLDLDGFKQVNDRLGHAAGDELLLEVAERLSRAVRPQDTVARLGGDEFALLLDERCGGGGVERLARRLEAAIAQPVPLGGAEVRVTASVGIAVARHDDRAEQLLEAADRAMYEAKKQGKARHVFSGRQECAA